MSHYQNPVLKLYAKYFGGINGPYSESIMLYLLHTHCSQTFGNDHGQVDNNWHHHLQPELDSSLSLHLYCFQNLFALLLCTLLLHFVYLSRQLNMAIEPHLLTLCDNTVNSAGHT